MVCLLISNRNEPESEWSGIGMDFITIDVFTLS